MLPVPAKTSHVTALIPLLILFAKMASGVAVTDDCSVAYQEIKMGVNGAKKYRYVQFKISDDLKRVEVEKKVEKTSPKDDFISFGEQLPENDCRFAIYDHELTSSDNVTRTQLFFIFWAPQSASVKKRMIYSSSKDAVMKKCGEATKPLQINEKDDWNEAEIDGSCKKV